MTSIEIHHTDAEKQSGSSSPAERHTFIPKQVIDTAWTTFKKYRKILLVLLVISFLPGLISGIIEMILLSLPATSEVVASQNTHMPERILLAPWDMIVAVIDGVSQIVGLWLGLGLIKAELLILEDQKPHYSIITSASGMQVLQGVIATAVVTLCTLL